MTLLSALGSRVLIGTNTVHVINLMITTNKFTC